MGGPLLRRNHTRPQHQIPSLPRHVTAIHHRPRCPASCLHPLSNQPGPGHEQGHDGHDADVPSETSTALPRHADAELPPPPDPTLAQYTRPNLFLAPPAAAVVLPRRHRKRQCLSLFSCNARVRAVRRSSDLCHAPRHVGRAVRICRRCVARAINSNFAIAALTLVPT